jgi:isoleucyl-tRNA synthetase
MQNSCSVLILYVTISYVAVALCWRVTIQVPCPVDSNGRFTDEVPEFKGRHVKEADMDICAAIKVTYAVHNIMTHPAMQ